MSGIAAAFLSAVPLAGFSQQADSIPTPKLTPSEISSLASKGESGDAIAARELAEAYVKGNGVPQNDEFAAKWYRKAADEGDATSQNRLGVMYSFGQGVEKNKEEAVRLYHRAAKQGYAGAMFNLGAAYYNGEGIASGLDMAYAWFVLAQEAGSTEAKDAVPRTAGEMKSTADAFEDIGAMYEQGEYLPQNLAQAARWYAEAAKQSDHAKLKLAQMLIDGHGIPQDYPRAMSLCRAAAESRTGGGQYCLGYLYANGFGSPKNLKEAVKWYQLAATTGVNQARRRAAALALAKMYSDGGSATPDHVEAYYWFTLAFDDGAAEAKSQCQALWPQLTKGEIKKLEAKFREGHLDPQKVFKIMQSP